MMEWAGFLPGNLKYIQKLHISGENEQSIYLTDIKFLTGACDVRGFSSHIHLALLGREGGDLPFSSMVSFMLGAASVDHKR